MTGFGSAEREGYKVEIRSLNHRYLDVNVRIPSALGSHEMAMRARAKELIGRGKIDITVANATSSSQTLSINDEAAKNIYSLLRGLAGGLSLTDENVTLSHMLYFKDQIVTDSEIKNTAPLMDAFEAALESLCQMRAREGSSLGGELAGMSDAISALNERIAVLAPHAIAARRDMFTERLREMLPPATTVMIDEHKIMMEAASYAERADITEEITRIRHHTVHLKEMLVQGGTIGRKLDFLLQELNREANTIGSKTDDPALIDLVIEMKAEIERAREQGQNIQ